MPSKNDSNGVRAPFESRGEHETGRRENQRSDDRNMGSSGEACPVGGFVGRNPYATVMTGFGIGFGFGLFVTLLMTRREAGWFERYAPEAIQQLPDRFKHLPDRLKHVPESLATYVPNSWKYW